MKRLLQPGRCRGVALLIVLWILVLLAIVAGTLALLANAEVMEARTLFDGTRARAAALGGLHRAVFELRNPDRETRWVPDGRSYEFELGAATVQLSIVDETGKLDLNSADEQTLRRLFERQGLEPQAAAQVTDAVLDPDELMRPNGAELAEYDSAGLEYGPRNGALATVEELQQVLGVSYRLYQAVEPAVTVFSGRNQINAAFAPPEALAILPQMEAADVRDFVAQREQQSGQSRQPLTLPDGTSVLPQRGGLTYSITARATLDNGAWSQVKATVRLGTDSLGQPFRIVRWREGVTE